MNDIALTPPVGNLTAFPDLIRPPTEAAGGDFGELLQSALNRVGALQSGADRAVEALTLGRETDIHSTLIAVEQAGIAMELAMQIRNKLLNAYETLMRQQI
jgi:flagellar hook-basal body complex protein FliE